jgi:starch-binding outer membrane protein, SusD/RagB family
MKKYLFLFALAAFLSGCDEEAFLKETPLDFMSGNNSYVTEADFDASVAELYYLTRFEFFNNGDYSIDYLYGTDLVAQGSATVSNLSSGYNATAAGMQEHWDKLYLLVAQANTVISRLPQSQVPEESRIKYEAKARFFRGLAYRTLAYLYGGVPLQLEESTSPKTDYVRATREETLLQAVEDVKFAAENLDDITSVEDGQISKPAAYHLLSELYLATDQYQLAVDAATYVINNPALALMQSRFGSRANEAPGDVYWDLFRNNNQNRSSGNTEGIFVIQEEVNVQGGGSSTSYYFWDRPGNYLLERHCAPQVGLFRIVYNGQQLTPFNWPIGDYTGGRGIGTAVPTHHFHDEVWENDWDNDIRNANHNFVRKFAFNNPSFIAQYGNVFGDSIDIMNPPAGATYITGLNSQGTFPGRYLMGYQTKCTMPYNHPSSLYSNPDTYALQGTAGGTYTDQYMFRLAETYLLRAEAYLKLGNLGSAASDINVVRTRSSATPVAAGDVTLDYILDERIRELGIEEKRRLTLGRLGEDIFFNRVTAYNPYYADPSLTADGLGFQRKFTLWPIPLSAIQANKDAVLEQTPGY